MIEIPDEYKVIKKIQIPQADILLFENNIVYTHIYGGKEIYIQDTETIHYAIREMTHNELCYRITSTENPETIPSYESRKFLISEERARFVLADAYIVKDYIPRMMLELYIRTRKIDFPVKAFTNFKNAYQWVSSLEK
ncbi:MAG: hypothetical protein D6707_03190 [Bacteroidetes bacterium]|nr:MAG: hypothetical protein D6707_03190 [Bacteroidota bacterium]